MATLLDQVYQTETRVYQQFGRELELANKGETIHASTGAAGLWLIPGIHAAYEFIQTAPLHQIASEYVAAKTAAHLIEEAINQEVKAMLLPLPPRVRTNVQGLLHATLNEVFAERETPFREQENIQRILRETVYHSFVKTIGPFHDGPMPFPLPPTDPLYEAWKILERKLLPLSSDTYLDVLTGRSALDIAEAAIAGPVTRDMLETILKQHATTEVTSAMEAINLPLTDPTQMFDAYCEHFVREPEPVTTTSS
jgi:hypothetical protein